MYIGSGFQLINLANTIHTGTILSDRTQLSLLTDPRKKLYCPL